MTGFPITLEEITAELKEDTPSDGRESYIPAWLEIESGQYTIDSARNQSSGNLFALIQANSLIIVPLGVEFLNKGQQVKVLRL
jgi:molybdopterin biosynthesis enzyme